MHPSRTDAPSVQSPTTQVAVLDADQVRLHQLTLPARSPGEIDVMITTAAICGSDLHTVLGHRSAPELAALGHEAVGVITAIDPGRTDAGGRPLAIGDRVALSMISFCGSCDRCRAGLTMKCRRLQKYGHDSVRRAPYATGMLADRVRLRPGVPVVAVPEEVDDTIIVSAGCATATAAAVLDAADPVPGESALVLGAGAVGFFCAAMLVTAGCRVVVRDPNPHRLAVVRNTGAATEDRDPETEYGLVIEASGSPNAFVDAVAATAIGGRLLMAGAVSRGASQVALDPAELVTRRTTLTGVHNYRTADFVAAVDWLLAHGAEHGVSRLMSPPFALHDIEQAFEEMQRGHYARVLVQPDSCGVR